MEDILSREEFEKLYKKGYVFKSETPEKIYSNYSLFGNSLDKNYIRTINALNNYNFDDIELEEMDIHVSEQIYNLLVRNNFYITDSRYNILKYNPLILISSLNNEYCNTLNLMIRKNKKGSIVSIPSFKRENDMLNNILLENQFLLNRNNISLIENSMVFLVASLQNDIDKTLKVLDKSAYNSIIKYDNYQAEFLLKYLLIDNKRKFKNLPTLIKNIIINYVNENYDNNKHFMDTLVKEDIFPVTYLSSDILIANDYLIDFVSDSKEVHNYIVEHISNYNSLYFCKEDEEKIISLLGKQYKDCKKIEDVLLMMKKRKLKRTNMSLLEMVVLQVYIAKELKSNDIERFIDVFSYSNNKDDLAEHYGDFLSLYIHAYKDDVVNMTYSLIHEFIHAIQLKNIEEGNIAEDNDIDIYSKDIVLWLLMGEDYYRSNYIRMSYEYDASIKSSIKTSKLFELVDIDFDNKDFLTFVRNYEKTYRKAIEENDYELSVNRNGVYNVNSLFEEEMKKLSEKDPEKYFFVFSQFPIIAYEYYSDGFRRKSIKELVDELDKCKTKKEIGIYFNVLKNRLSCDKEGDLAVCNNIEEIKRIYKNNKYNDITEKILSRIIMIAKNEEKYRGYFYKNGGNKR